MKIRRLDIALDVECVPGDFVLFPEEGAGGFASRTQRWAGSGYSATHSVRHGSSGASRLAIYDKTAQTFFRAPNKNKRANGSYCAPHILKWKNTTRFEWRLFGDFAIFGDEIPRTWAGSTLADFREIAEADLRRPLLLLLRGYGFHPRRWKAQRLRAWWEQNAACIRIDIPELESKGCIYFYNGRTITTAQPPLPAHALSTRGRRRKSADALPGAIEAGAAWISGTFQNWQGLDAIMAVLERAAVEEMSRRRVRLNICDMLDAASRQTIDTLRAAVTAECDNSI